MTVMEAWLSSRDPKYPEVEVRLTGEDGNAFAVIGAVIKAMKAAKVTADEIDAYIAEATAGNYNQLLGTTMRWVYVS